MDCPKNASNWKRRADNLRCQHNDVYHCLLLEDKSKVKEVCIERTLINQGYCPIITRHNYLHWAHCNTTGCPNDTFKSDEVYKYPACFIKNSSTSIRAGDIENDPLSLTGILVTILLLVIVVAVILGVFCIRRLQKRRARKATNEAGHLLLKDKGPNDVVRGVLQELKNNNIILICGKLGDGVSNTGKTVVTHFLQEHPDWEHQWLNYRDCLNSPLTDDKIIFVDGWFGLWNENPCDITYVRESLKALRQCIETLQRFKIILGIRDDVYEKYKKTFTDYLPTKRRLDLDSIQPNQDKELKQQLEDNLSNVDCKEPNCKCATLKIQDIKDKDDNVGNHLKVEILANHHNIITKFMESADLFETLVSHLDGLKHTKRCLYECLMYIVIKGKYKEGEEIEKHVCNDFGFRITPESFKDCESINKYTKQMLENDLVNIQTGATSNDPESSYIVFRHVLLYLCAFHSLFKTHPKLAIKHCNINAVLQIVRPGKIWQAENDTKFCVTAEEECVTYFYNEVIRHSTDLENITDHPLVKCAKALLTQG